MKTLKRTTTLLLALCLLFSCWGTEADAAVYSSNYFSSYGCYVHNVGGKVTFTATISAVHTMDRLGVTLIHIYKADGTFVKTVYGSTSNGLLEDNNSSFAAEYIYQGVAGTSYYGVVYFTCRDSTGSDSRHVTTNVA